MLIDRRWRRKLCIARNDKRSGIRMLDVLIDAFRWNGIISVLCSSHYLAAIRSSLVHFTLQIHVTIAGVLMRAIGIDRDVFSLILSGTRALLLVITERQPADVCTGSAKVQAFIGVPAYPGKSLDNVIQCTK